jgi:hypothetical protein
VHSKKTGHYDITKICQKTLLIVSLIWYAYHTPTERLEMLNETKVPSFINIPVRVDPDELWAHFWGSGFENDPVTSGYVVSIDFGDSIWDEAGEVSVTYLNEKNKKCSRIVDINDIAEALATVIRRGIPHFPCGGSVGVDFENWDACIGDLILQHILFGEVVYA